jgi:DegV family protein with EDD domain
LAKVRILTDSAADLPSEVLDRYSIGVIPFPVSFASETYLDGVDLDRPTFYSRLAQSAELPKTSQITPATFIEEFTRATSDESDVVYIGLSSGLSGTAQAARMARDMLPDPAKVFTVDSLAASVGEGILVLRAAEMAKQGASARVIAETCENIRGNLNCIFTIDTLEYLKKGGRITAFKAAMGGMLNLKPVLHVNREGHIVQLEIARGRKKAVRRLIEIIEEKGKDLASQVIGVNHSRAPEEAEALAAEIRDRFACREVVTGEIGATVGTHVGPGTLSVFFFGEKV